MKKLLIITCLLFGVIAQANVNLRYYNKDSKTHKFEVKIAGSTKTVEFGSSRTASVTIQGGSEKAEIKTDCGWITVTNNSKIEIKDGCIVIK
ncbi:hypothetical protein [Aquimarina mytili]|uniref:hypothetical protein n=1 Tax=Aquimarina mytili TaxID=874423 RepID=UPI001F3C2D8F|nr:hypothetical protein [Aquimarina mytili]